MNDVLFVTNGYPSEESPFLCHFIKTQKNQIESYSNYRVRVLYKNGVFGYLSLIFSFIFLLKKYKVIHVHQGLTLVAISPILLALNRKIILSVLNEHENEFIESRLNNFLRLYFDLILESCVSHVITKNDRDQMFYNKKKLKHSVIPNGVTLLESSPVTSMDYVSCVSDVSYGERPLKILFVSSKSLWRPQKRFDLFLELIDNLSIPFEYLVAYDDSNELLQSKYRWADVHVLTSGFEGSPNSVKEAVSNGCWVVSFDVGDVKQIISGSKYSRVVADLDDMINVLNSSWNDFTSSREVRELLVINKYDAASAVKRIIEIYEEF